MPQLSQDDLAAVLDVLEAIHAAGEPGAFPNLALTAVGSLIPDDLGLFLIFDLSRQRILSCVLRPEQLGIPELQQVYERYLAEHPLLAQYRRNGEARTYQLSDVLHPGEFHCLDLYQVVYRR